METFVYRDKKLLRCGYTTGTCAALAAKAAVTFLATGRWPSSVGIRTPKGEWIEVEVEECRSGGAPGAVHGDRGSEADAGERAGGTEELRENSTGRPLWAECAVRKDAGDDYDVTDGLLIFSRAELVFGSEAGSGAAHGIGITGGSGAAHGIEITGGSDVVHGNEIAGGSGAAHGIEIDGGVGVGRVTKPGLDQPVGAAAINSVPRRMIAEAVGEVLEECGLEAGVKITVSVPGGEETAAKTFNPLLGIAGGISILGTSGIVEPMSEEALVETIRAHLNVLRAEGRTHIAAVPGNMGEGFLRGFLMETQEKRRETPVSCFPRPDASQPEGFGDEGSGPLPIVTCSNFIGKTIDMAGELGFSGLLIAGHLGKLVKLGNGIMNTHSREGDGRMDTLVSCALAAGADLAALRRIQNSNTTEEALSVLSDEGVLNETLRVLCGRIDRYVKRRAMDRLKTGVILFDAGGRVLGTTDGAMELLEAVVSDRGHGI